MMWPCRKKHPGRNISLALTSPACLRPPKGKGHPGPRCSGRRAFSGLTVRPGSGQPMRQGTMGHHQLERRGPREARELGRWGVRSVLEILVGGGAPRQAAYASHRARTNTRRRARLPACGSCRAGRASHRHVLRVQGRRSAQLQARRDRERR